MSQQPPLTNIELEQQLIGTILMNNKAYFTVNTFLKPVYFSEPIHQEMYRVIGDMIADEKVCNPISVKPYLPNMEIGDLTPNQYLAHLATNAVSVTNAKSFGESLRELALRRQLLYMCEDVAKELKESTLAEPVKNFCSTIYQLVADVEDQSIKGKGSTNYGKILERAVESVRKEVSGEDKRVSWFLPEVQEVAGHARPGNLIGIMSDSGGGKTSFSLQQCQHAAEEGFKTAFFSIEVTAEEASLQAAAQRLQIPLEKIDSLELNEDEKSRLDAEMQRTQPFEIVEFSTCTLADIRATCKSLKQTQGLDFVIIDHAKYIEPPGRNGDMFAERVNGLYRGLKAIAKEVGIAICILIQRNDTWKKRESPRPMEGDAYGGGGVKQSLDIWFSIYRPDVFEEYLRQKAREKQKQADKDRIATEIEKSRGKAWIINHKRRRGAPNGSEPVYFDGETVSFRSIPPGQASFF